MEKNEKIKLAITAGIAGAILLIFVLFLALSGRKESDDEKLSDSISEYASAAETSNTEDDNAALLSSTADEDSTGESTEKSAEISSNTTLYTEFENSQKSDTVSGNSFYATRPAVLKNVYKGLTYDAKAQLKEMMTYWADNNMEAVRDLAHLERYEVMSYELGGSADFLYYGDTNSSGEPDGTGIAVYGNDQYYYGQWKSGVRSGTGTWVAFYPSYSTYVVTEHIYTGEWADDLPTGEGHEHYDYNPEYMNSEDVYLQNAIGTFDAGLYSGEMYVITVNADDETNEWYGTCDHGNWVQVINTTKDKYGKIPVLGFNNDGEKSYLYMSEEGAKNSGITGIITGGRALK